MTCFEQDTVAAKFFFTNIVEQGMEEAPSLSGSVQHDRLINKEVRQTVPLILTKEEMHNLGDNNSRLLFYFGLRPSSSSSFLPSFAYFSTPCVILKPSLLPVIPTSFLINHQDDFPVSSFSSPLVSSSMSSVIYDLVFFLFFSESSSTS